MSLKVLVTGGAGFIGSHIVDALLKLNHQVVVIDDLSSGDRGNLSDQARFFYEDIRNPDAWHTVKQAEPDVIVHAAAQMSVSESMKDPVSDLEINLVGMLNILSSLDIAKLPYFLFISTGGAIYGEQEIFPAPENHPIRPTSVYGQSKYAAEMYLDLWKRVYALNYGVLRLANVYGPRQNPHGEAGVVAIFLQKLFSDQVPTIFGTGEITRDYVYVSDVVEAVLKMIQSKSSEIFNIGTGLETSVNNLYLELLKATGKDIAANYGPPRAGDQARSVIDSAFIKQELNWTPQVELKQGLKLTADWFRQQS